MLPFSLQCVQCECRTQLCTFVPALCRMMGALRVAPAAAAARLSPEASPRPVQPGLSVGAATRAEWDAWELVDEEQAMQAEAGWRELLAEKRARRKSRNGELEVRHAAARMIQVSCCRQPVVRLRASSIVLVRLAAAAAAKRAVALAYCDVVQLHMACCTTATVTAVHATCRFSCTAWSVVCHACFSAGGFASAC